MNLQNTICCVEDGTGSKYNKPKKLEINSTALYVTCIRDRHSLFNVVTDEGQLSLTVQSSDLMVANY